MSKTSTAAALAVILSAAAIGLAGTPALGQTKAGTAKSTAAKSAAAKVSAAKPADDDAVDPDAVQALQKMSAYLKSLPGFELRADTTVDLVTNDGQRIQLGGVSRYRLRAPNAFHIDVTTDVKDRSYYYDGKQFTVVSPGLGYYASAPAPATIRETLDTIYEKFGIVLPLEDLFRWSDSRGRPDQLTSAWEVGPATVDGAKTTHYAFRQPGKDWEIWIEQGERPLPRKLVIVDKSDEAGPGYAARLTWNTAPTFADSDFAYRPAPDVKRIQFAATK